MMNFRQSILLIVAMLFVLPCGAEILISASCERELKKRVGEQVVYLRLPEVRSYAFEKPQHGPQTPFVSVVTKHTDGSMHSWTAQFGERVNGTCWARVNQLDERPLGW